MPVKTPYLRATIVVLASDEMDTVGTSLEMADLGLLLLHDLTNFVSQI